MVHVDSVVIIVLLKVNKQVEGKIRDFKGIKKTKKKQGNKGTTESRETREVAYTCRYTSRHAILMVLYIYIFK